MLSPAKWSQRARPWCAWRRMVRATQDAQGGQAERLAIAFEVAGQPVAVPVAGNISANEAMTLQKAALAGAGIAMLPSYQTADALRYLETQAASAYDVVFLDPPFNQNLLPAVCALLEERQWLADDAWIYTESENAPSTLGLPGAWRLHREQKSGRVYYALWHRLV